MAINLWTICNLLVLMLLLVLLLLSDAWLQVEAVRFGDKCIKSYDCYNQPGKPTTGITCKWTSPSCLTGVCTCADGYTEDSENYQCRKAVKLGEQCWSDGGDQCAAENSICFNSICRCSTGFKPGLRGDDCIPSKMLALSYGDSCYYRVALFHDAYCPYNMVCTPTGCACPPGFVVNKTTNYDCVQINLGDGCSTDVDCSQNTNSICLVERNHTCGCRPGYRIVRYRYGNDWRQRCVKKEARLLVEGDYCGDAFPFGMPFLTMSGICSEPYSCVACLNTHSPARICGIVRQDGDDNSPATAPAKYERRQRLLGERCDSMFRAECVIPNSDCINGICQCIPGTGCVFKDYDSSAGLFDVRRNAVMIGHHCSSDSDCSGDGSMVCQPVSSSCSKVISPGQRASRGVCACASPNYIERVYRMHDSGLRRDSIRTCSRKLRLGEICSKSRTHGRGICSAANSDCLFGVCQCVTGYKLAPWGDECIADEQNRYYGEKCLFSEECYWGQAFEFPMACLDNTCGCLAGTRPGMTNPDGPAYGCVANRLSDRCMSDMDCHLYWRYNWHCSQASQQCECNMGYYAAKLNLRDGNMVTQWCVPYNASLQPEGGTCKQTIQDIDVPNICASPLVCSSCEDVYNNDGICGWAPPAEVSVSQEAMVMAYTSNKNDATACLATPIDNDLQLLLVPGHCFAETPLISDRSQPSPALTIEILIRSVDGRNISLYADSLIRYPSTDIALIQFKTDARNYLPAAVELPAPPFCDELINCTTSYAPLWLGTETILETKAVDIIPTTQCQQEYGKRTDTVSQRTLCAGRYQASVSSKCELESSHGPLTCRNPNGRLVIAGLPVRLPSCAVAGMPRVFSRVCYSLDWINQARMILSQFQPLNNPSSRTSTSQQSSSSSSSASSSSSLCSGKT